MVLFIDLSALGHTDPKLVSASLSLCFFYFILVSLFISILVDFNFILILKSETLSGTVNKLSLNVTLLSCHT